MLIADRRQIWETSPYFDLKNVPTTAGESFNPAKGRALGVKKCIVAGNTHEFKTSAWLNDGKWVY